VIPAPIPVSQLLEERRLASLKLKLLAGGSGAASRFISNPRIQKPGLALAGYLPYVKPGRLQIIGESEFAYLDTLPEEEARLRFKNLLGLDIPAAVTSKGRSPEDSVLQFCDEHEIPFFVTTALTSDTIATISAFLEDALALRINIHGVLVEVFSLGTLIIGDPGIGKSECALELVHRGHRLVADDVVVVSRSHDYGLRGKAHHLLKNFLELRGVGIIDVRKHFGMPATSSQATISLVIELVKLGQATSAHEWREQLMQQSWPWAQTEDILGYEVPKYTMAVAPGRDVAIMVETAVRKCMLADRGIQDEREFLEAIDRLARDNSADGTDDGSE
jgi:HPr kinase/phosphorylase